MIRIRNIFIKEFRGIKNLNLDFRDKSFGIYGPNGSGKSGVVDAIEFCIRGKITRLSGEGQGDISIRKHAPHVDQKENPDKSEVTITAVIPSCKKEVTITRCVKNPKEIKIVPENFEAEEIIRKMELHPEFILSRREIAKFIIIPPTERSQAIQSLLRIEYIDNLRKEFVTCERNYRRNAEDAKRAMHVAEKAFQEILELNNVAQNKLLEKVNEQRGILDLPALAEITPETSFKEGIADKQSEDKKPDVDKNMALKSIEALTNAIASDEPDALKEQREIAFTNLNKLQEDEETLALTQTHDFITSGLNFVTADMCPLCDKFWNMNELRRHLEKKISKYEELNTLLERLNSAIASIIGSIEERHAAVLKVVDYGMRVNFTASRVELDSYAKTLADIKIRLEAFRDNRSQIEEMTNIIQGEWWKIPAEAQMKLSEIQKDVNALPDSSDKSKAASFLTELQLRYEESRKKAKEAKKAEEQQFTAKKALDCYNAASNKILEDIYCAVAEEFARFYKSINNDENKFSSKIEAKNSKVNLEVDFWGRGLYPPGAYHSEGHQDGMGFCLYLALMKHMHGEDFTFAVLDDVLMSVDIAHRGEVCQLLKNEFPKTQFILTTHDRAWFRYMKTRNLIEGRKTFANWNVETGPNVWDNKDIWTDIENALNKDDIRDAASLLRYYLEDISAILANNLRAKVEYRSDARYDLGDLLPPVIKQWTALLKKGIESANKWNQAEEKDRITALLEKAKMLIQETCIDQWTINPSVHFNEWANFRQVELKSVTTAFKNFLEHVRCSKCRGYPRIIPNKGPLESLACDCSAISINLKT